MAAIASLRYPSKSHRKQVRLPQPSTQLAEFVGIMLGDGGINNPWQTVISVNSAKDRKYAAFISNLCLKLFGIAPAVQERKTRNTLVIRLASTTIVDFLIGLGISRGNKLKNGLRIPHWILKKPAFRKACVRGLVDTDGCLYIHTHTVAGKTYKHLGLNFKSYSPELLLQVAAIFEEFGIIPHISGQGRDIFLYRADAVAKYLAVFGTSNDRIRSVYKKWRGG